MTDKNGNIAKAFWWVMGLLAGLLLMGVGGSVATYAAVRELKVDVRLFRVDVNRRFDDATHDIDGVTDDIENVKDKLDEHIRTTIQHRPGGGGGL